MQIRVPVVIKQKFGVLARLAYIGYITKEDPPDTIVSGHVEVSGPIQIPGVTFIPLTVNHATVSLPLSKLEELAQDSNLTHFELAGAMS